MVYLPQLGWFFQKHNQKWSTATAKTTAKTHSIHGRHRCETVPHWSVGILLAGPSTCLPTTDWVWNLDHYPLHLPHADLGNHSKCCCGRKHRIRWSLKFCDHWVATWFKKASKFPLNLKNSLMKPMKTCHFRKYNLSTAQILHSNWVAWASQFNQAGIKRNTKNKIKAEVPAKFGTSVREPCGSFYAYGCTQHLNAMDRDFNVLNHDLRSIKKLSLVAHSTD